MPEAVIARNAGFCPGVRAATERLQRRIDTRRAGERIFTLGHLIHNEDYNASLAARGVRAIRADELEGLAHEACESAPVTVFIRAHGITVQTRALLERLRSENPSFDFVDCTCVFVEKIHRIASEKNGACDSHVFICLGSKTHPEVEGFMSCFEGEKYVFAAAEELEAAV